MGQALANYVKFEKRGFVITGLFDVDVYKRQVKGVLGES